MGRQLGKRDPYTGHAWKPAWDDDFRAGFAAAARAKKYQPPTVAYSRYGKKYGVTWVDGYGAYIDLTRGAYAQPGARYAKSLGLSVKMPKKKNGGGKYSGKTTGWLTAERRKMYGRASSYRKQGKTANGYRKFTVKAKSKLLGIGSALSARGVKPLTESTKRKLHKR